jgi:membrane-bound lytic murein transglycosylase D
MKVSQQAADPTVRSFKPRLAGRLLLLALGLGAGPVLAQQTVLPPALPAATDTVRRVVDLPPAELDSLAAAPLQPIAVDSARLLWLQIPPTQYELVSDRMACLTSDMPLHFNEAVLAYVKLFTERQRGYTQRVLEREQFYFPTFEKYLAQYKLPIDLKYLSVVESALIPTAKSAVGAVGLWQFMPPTAGDLRLKRDEWVDERMHPEKATEAACKHLRYLYGIFHDWELVLAAYNWGAGNVHRVMRRTGKKTFWELYPHLPAETRNYVPTFTAVLYAMKYAPDYRLNDQALRYQRFETLDTLGLAGQAFDLRRLSRALGYQDSTAMSRYNPEVRKGALPAGYRPYVLRFPSTARPQLEGVDRATLLSYCQPQAELPRPLAPRPVYITGYAPAAALLAAGGATGEAAPRYQRVHYTVRRGQSLAEVAERFDVTPSQLRRWNGLAKSTPVRPGRELLVLRRVSAPAASPAEPVVAAIPAPPPPLPRLVAPVDSAAQALVAANARYVREAQARAERETAQRQELVRLQRQQAARVVAQQRAAALKAVALAKAAAAEEKARRLALVAPKSNPTQPDTQPLLAASADSSTQTLPSRQAGRLVAVAASPAAEETASPIRRLLATEPESSTRPRASRTADLPAEASAQPALARAKAPRAEPERPAYYTVQAGDNLTRIAREHDLSIDQLRDWNQLPADASVLAGQRLRLHEAAATDRTRVSVRTQPSGTLLPHVSTHTVQRGDTLFNISQRFNVSVQELRRLNHLKSDEVKLGQKLVVPAAS